MSLSVSKEKTLLGRIVGLIIRFIIRPISLLLLIKNIRGKENIPNDKKSFIVVANHQSYLDFLLYIVFGYKVHFLAAEKLFNSRFTRCLMECTGQIKVDRKAENKDLVMQKVKNVLNNNGILGLFPQGTRSRDGEIGKVYTGVAKFCLSERVKVVPVGIKNAFEIWPPQSKWPLIKKNLEFVIGESMDFSSYENTEENYEVVTNIIMKKVAELAGKKFYG